MSELPGFDPRWKDFPDYIIGITHEIWEERQISTLHHYYSDDIIVRAPASVVVGNKGVIGATMSTLSEFPDRTLLGEDVIWCGDKENAWLSSHRIYSQATHSNVGVYGEPTGKKLGYRIIADCAARDNQIFDEWLIRDQGAIVRQLGMDPIDYARNAIEAEGGVDACVKPLTPDNDIAGPYVSKGNNHPVGARYEDILTRIMGAEISAIPAEYDRACQLELPGGVTEHGSSAADQFWMGLRASFPSAEFKVYHTIGRDDENRPHRAAVRWSLHGKHDGWGTFGRPTNANVYILGISHAEFGPYGLNREFVLYDETSVWKQILMQQGG